MSKDISPILRGWDYDPEGVSVRMVPGADGREKVQVRLELGLLQMELNGRPDGHRVADEHESWLDYYEARCAEHEAKFPDGPPRLLEPAECLQLLREGVQYYHRYISFWHLQRYELCARDTRRNLRLFQFVNQYARHEKDKLQFDQWRPYVTMMHARSVAMPLVLLGDYRAAVQVVDVGIKQILAFLEQYDQLDRAAECEEYTRLTQWRQELAARLEDRPSAEVAGGRHDSLEQALRLAVEEERFEDAARLRDQLRRL